MLETLYSLPFLVLEVPNLKIKQPTWFHQPSAMTVFSLVLLSYFLVTGGNCAIRGRRRHHLYATAVAIISRYFNFRNYL